MRKRERKEREGGKDLWATSLLLLPPLHCSVSVLPSASHPRGQIRMVNKKQRTPVSMSTGSTQIVVSKYHSPGRGTGILQ